jgi:hypothetical protein
VYLSGLVRFSFLLKRSHCPQDRRGDPNDGGNITDSTGNTVAEKQHSKAKWDCRKLMIQWNFLELLGTQKSSNFAAIRVPH